MKFYYSPGNCALASHIALSEAEAQFEAIRIDFGSDQQRSRDYLALNPKGRVPALVTERGVLTETPAILAFIAQSYPAAALAPLEDAYEFAQVQAFNSYLCSTVHVAHAHKGRGQRWANSVAAIEEMRTKVPQTVGECFALIESEYFKGPWVRGENYTVCDAYLFTLGSWLEGDGLERESFPQVEAHAKRMLDRPRVKKAMDEHFA